jgi:hypothetical protein
MRMRIAAGAVVFAFWLVAAGTAWGDSITPLCTVGSSSAQPCATGWYTAPVFLSWTWDPLTSGSGSCPTGPYDSDTNTTVSCTVTWTGGPQLTYTTPLLVEVSGINVTASASRQPDSNGWYNHPLSIAFQGSSFSSPNGSASCTPETSYAGPNAISATVSGTCSDNAGKTVTVTSTFHYDATAPSLSVTATSGDESTVLSWQAGGDIAPIVAMTVARTSSSDAKDPVVYSGTASGFDDTNLKNGVHYTYTVTAEDAAGNTATRTLQVTPAARLLSPAANAHVSAPPALAWTAVPGATYYNVQLYRGDPTKLLSLWPVRASLQLRRTWRFDGRRYHLKPGRYKWYVWPGFGKRKAARYGHMVGSGTFIVVR